MNSNGFRFWCETRVIKRFKFDTLPEKLIGLPYIIAERGSYKVPGIGFSFKVDKPVTIYLFVDGRMKEGPEGWTKTDMKSSLINAKKVHYDFIYKKDFKAGTITIPSNPAKILPYCVAVEAK